MPYHPLLSLGRLDWFYRHIADNCSKPLWIYTSGNWSRPVTPEFVSTLKQHPNIAGIKFSTRDAVAVTKVAALAEKDFQVITAVASQLHACLCMGSKAHTSSLASSLPEFLIRIYELFLNGRYDESLNEQHRLNKFLEEFSKNTKKDNFLQAADEKYLLSLRGICDEYVTSYYREVDEEEKQRLQMLVSKFSLF
jgi:4-hydroxy-tetrahydrodipicolinate synthase